MRSGPSIKTDLESRREAGPKGMTHGLSGAREPGENRTAPPRMDGSPLDETRDRRALLRLVREGFGWRRERPSPVVCVPRGRRLRHGSLGCLMLEASD